MKNNKDPLSKLIDANPCAKCRAKRLPGCKCAAPAGGGGSGGGAGSSTAENKADLQAEKKSYAFEGIANNMNHEKSHGVDSYNLGVSSLDKVLDDKSIAKFVTLKLDMSKGILSLKCKPGLSKKEKEAVKKLFKKIKIAFNEFKEQLKNNGVDVKAYTAELTDDSITINIPNQKHFKDFINLLADKKIINILDLEKKQAEKTEEKHFNPSPFKTRPTPKGYDD